MQDWRFRLVFNTLPCMVPPLKLHFVSKETKTLSSYYHFQPRQEESCIEKWQFLIVKLSLKAKPLNTISDMTKNKSKVLGSQAIRLLQMVFRAIFGSKLVFFRSQALKTCVLNQADRSSTLVSALPNIWTICK